MSPSNPSNPEWQLQIFKAEFFKALAHPIRIRLLEVLRHGERSVQDLQATLDLDQPIVSQQLAILRAKNVVTARKAGTTVSYAVRCMRIQVEHAAPRVWMLDRGDAAEAPQGRVQNDDRL